LGSLRRILSRLKRRILPAASLPPAAPAGQSELRSFVCNLCGHDNSAVPLEQIQNREFQSCRVCRSSLRMRSIVYALSKELFGKPVKLIDFPTDKTIVGLGMSDWQGYAQALEQKFAYTNTFYHEPPHMDITRIPEAWAGQYRFLISSDVFEHIPLPDLDAAFANSRRLLAPGGIFIFSVPFFRDGATREHFPELHDFRIIETNGKRFLYNRSAQGVEQVFDQLVFHGGGGMTLEMRVFSEGDLRRRLAAAGYSSVRLADDRDDEFGIHWPTAWDLPIVARV
jgi:hypothetical protein